MVIDAYDTVTFGALFEDSLAGDGVTSDVGNWLEVASRRSEWLNDVIGPDPRLPYAQGGGPFPDGYTYVLRGSGSDNPDIGDGAPAWVLEWEPGQAAPLPVEEYPTIEGCPVLMESAAGELGITAENLQMSIGQALALNPNIQPCQTCSNLMDAAVVLRDDEGAGLGALAQVLIDAGISGPTISEEQVAALLQTMADMSENPENAAYADASTFDDALAAYVGSLLELGLDSEQTLSAVSKYSETDNEAITAYIELRLVQLSSI